MRVLLIQSPLGGAEPPVYPAGLACLAPVLRRAGHVVRVFDPNISSSPPDSPDLPDPTGQAGSARELAAIIGDFAPEAVGVSLRNIDSTNKRVVVFYYQFFKELLQEIRALTKAPIIAGGSGFSMFAERVMADEPLVDYGVYLEGENAFAALLGNLAAPWKAPSVFYRSNGRVEFSGPGEKAEGPDIGPLDFSVLPLAPYLGMPWGVGLETKRGCALSCVYCPYGFLNGKRYRLKSPETVAEEAANLEAQGARRFTFLDSVFNIPKEHAAAVCRALIARGTGLKWSAWFNERELDRELLDLAIAAGCENVIFSPDAFSDAALKKLGKSISTADIERAFSLVRDRTEIEASWNFFKNPPGQSLSAFLSMARFVVKARRAMGRRAHFEFNSLRVEPHTALEKLAIEEGIIRQGEDLLKPVYFTQKSTRYIEWCMNAGLRALKK